jgi:hypothetical protein
MQLEEMPVVDPETGEILAASEEDRRYLIDTYAADLVIAEKAARRAREARGRLALLMRVGDAVAVEPGWAVTVRPPASPKRSVVAHAIDEHREALTPLGLGPVEKTVVTTEYPKVSDLTSAASRAALARAGLTPERFLDTPAPGDPVIAVVAPEGAA